MDKCCIVHNQDAIVACLRGYEEGSDALIGGAVTVPDVQVNESCGLHTRPHEPVVRRALLLARPSAGMSLSVFVKQTCSSLLE